MLNRKRRFAAGLLASVLTVTSMGMYGCGGKDKDGDDIKYVAGYEHICDYSLYSLSLCGDYITGSYYTYDEEGEDSQSEVIAYDIKSQTVNEIISLGNNDNIMCSYMDDSNNYNALIQTFPDEEEDEGGIDEMKSEDFVDNSTYKYIKYDLKGNKIEEKPVENADTDDIYSMNGFLGRYNGKNYVLKSVHSETDETKTYIAQIDDEFNTVSQVEIKKEINTAVISKGGEFIVSYYDDNYNDLIGKVDMKTGEVKKLCDDKALKNGIRNIYIKDDNTVYVLSYEALYEMDIKSGKITKLFKFIDAEVDGDYIEYVICKEGKPCFVISDYENNTTDLVTFTKMKKSEVNKGKTVLTVSTLYDSDDLNKMVINFNKNSDKYKLEIKTYLEDLDTDDYEKVYKDALNRFNADIASGKAGDIIDTSSVNVNMLANKGVLCDLTEYMKKDKEVNKDTLVENVLKASEIDGKIYAIPENFSLLTYAGKKSLLGNKDSWNFDEFVSFCKNMPVENLFAYTDEDTVLEFAVSGSLNNFIDWSTGECKFDTKEFKDVLELSKNTKKCDLMNISDEGAQYVEPETLMAENKMLLKEMYISTYEDYAFMMKYLKGDITYIGSPNDNKYPVQITSLGQTALAINAKSKNKDAAWDIIRERYLEKNQKDGYAFPVNKKVYDEKLQESMKKSYTTDENGAQVESPIMTYGFGDVEVDIYAATEEEMEQFKEFAGKAQTMYCSDNSINSIIVEEAEAYFKGDKSVDEVAKIIQSRVSLYIKENK